MANLLSFTETFNADYWNKWHLAAYIDYILAPNGTLTAEKMIENVTLTSYAAVGNQNLLSIAPLSDYTLSVFCKAAERNTITLAIYTPGTTYSAYFDLSTVTSSSIYPSGIISYPNSWYRLWFRPYVVESSCTTTFFVGITTPHSLIYGNGLYLWGAQLEIGNLTDYFVMQKPYLNSSFLF